MKEMYVSRNGKVENLKFANTIFDCVKHLLVYQETMHYSLGKNKIS